jgi:hypothetical protein
MLEKVLPDFFQFLEEFACSCCAALLIILSVVLKVLPVTLQPKITFYVRSGTSVRNQIQAAHMALLSISSTDRN